MGTLGDMNPLRRVSFKRAMSRVKRAISKVKKGPL